MPEPKKQEEITDGLDDLLEDDFPAAKDDPQPSDEDDKTTPAAEPKPDDPPADAKIVEDDATAAKPPTDDAKPVDEGKPVADDGEGKDEKPPKYKYRDKEYELSELLADPKLAQDVFTAANQQVHYQDLHGESKTKLNELSAQMEEIREKRQADEQAEYQRRHQAEEQRVAEEQTMTPDQMQAAYKPVMKELVEKGWVEEDLEQLYPGALTGFLTMRDTVFTRLAAVEQALGQVVQSTQQRGKTEAAVSAYDQINSYLGEVSKEGGIFAPLADEAVRSKFLITVRDTLNPPGDLLMKNPDILRKYWIGQNHQALLESVDMAKNEEQARIDKARQLAAGEGGGARPSATSPAPIPGQDEGWGDL